MRMKMELSAKQKELLDELIDITNEFELILQDESVLSLPKAHKKIQERLELLTGKIEDGEYVETPPEAD